MQLPFTRALLWLFIVGKSRDEIKCQLDEISLPTPDVKDWEEIELQASNLALSPSLRKRLAKRHYDRLDLALLEKLGFDEIYCKHVGNYTSSPKVEAAWDEVGRILKNPVLRIAIDVGILCKYKLEELVQILPQTYQENLSEAGIELYCKYFFNHTSMSKLDWRGYLRTNAEVPYAYVRYHAALTKPRDEALFLAGLPTRADFSGFLKTVLGTAAYKFQFYSRMNTPLADGQARSWAKVGFDAGVRFEKFSATDVTDFSKSIQTAFEYENEEIETLPPDLLTQIKPPTEDKTVDSQIPTPGPMTQQEFEV